MSARPRPWQSSAVTVSLITLLHAFTHAFAVMLLPLYFLVQRDLGLPGVKWVALVVTAYSLAYWGLSVFAGKLADRLNRKVLLGVGLIGNAVAIGLMGYTQRYEVMLGLGVVAGLFGTLFHPAANALASAHYHRSPGTVIGIIGIGAGLGFFVGPQYAGWRAEAVGWERPLIEAGIAGVLVGIVFLLVAREAPHHAADGVKPQAVFGGRLRRLVLGTAMLIGLRDFAAHGSATLASIYLQRAQGRTAKEAGWVLGAMMLSSMVVNPIAVWASPRRRRLPAFVVSVIVGGAILAGVPFVGAGWTLAVLLLFQAFSMASFALGDAAMLERVDPSIRGRVVGQFLTLAGTIGASAAWVMGWWADRLADPSQQRSYLWPFATLGALMAVSALAVRIIRRFGEVDRDEESERQAEAMAVMMAET